jgi:hypothetical protein
VAALAFEFSWHGSLDTERPAQPPAHAGEDADPLEPDSRGRSAAAPGSTSPLGTATPGNQYPDSPTAALGPNSYSSQLRAPLASCSALTFGVFAV